MKRRRWTWAPGDSRDLLAVGAGRAIAWPDRAGGRRRPRPAQRPVPLHRRPAGRHHPRAGQPADPDAEPRPPGGVGLRLPQRLLHGREHPGRLPAQPDDAPERPFAVPPQGGDGRRAEPARGRSTTPATSPTTTASAATRPRRSRRTSRSTSISRTTRRSDRRDTPARRSPTQAVAFLKERPEGQAVPACTWRSPTRTTRAS